MVQNIKQGDLTGGHRLAKNVAWNLLGTGAPLFMAIVAIPVLVGAMGAPRFGVLTLAWMVVGYFSLFDLGLGRALTKLVAEKLAANKIDEIPGLVWTAMAMMAVLGLVGALLIGAISSWLVNAALKIPENLQAETLQAFYLLSFSIPIVITTTALRGILEAHQRFDLVNIVRVPLGIFTFLGPLIVLPFSNSLVAVVAMLVFVRVIAWVVHIILCFHVSPELRNAYKLNRKSIRPLLQFGSWLTVTNIVGPLMVYLDRFLIGVVVSMTAVAYYATPYEVVTKLGVIPSSLMGVFFPAFVTALIQNRKHAAKLFNRGVKYVFLSLFPFVLIIVTMAHDGLELWLGSDFSENSTYVMQLLVIGVFVNGLAQLPFGMLQSLGRPDLVAKLHLAELPIYLMFLWFMLVKFGIEGAAIAWLMRTSIDAIILFMLSNKYLMNDKNNIYKVLPGIAIASLLIISGFVIIDLKIKLLYILMVMVGYFIISWIYILEHDEKSYISNRVKKILN